MYSMESTITTSTNGNSWEIVPANTVVGIILGVLFIYLFFRHFMFVLMFMDLILGWLRKFNWFPKEGKRRKTFIHWVIALALFLGFLSVTSSAGWLEFIPQ
jgi:CDP-diglyceride synthetase